MMSLLKFTMIFSLIGLLTPLTFQTLWNILNQRINIGMHIIIERIMIILWPTSLITLPSSQEPQIELKLFLFSLAANVVLYSVIGALIWIGLRKHVTFLLIPGISLLAMWWWLLTR